MASSSHKLGVNEPRCGTQWSIAFLRVVFFFKFLLRAHTNDSYVLKPSEVASSTRIAAFVRGKSKTDDNDERERKRLEKVGQVLKEWRRRRCYGMTEVLPRLFVGSMGDATDVEQLLANKVSFFFGILEIPLKKYFQDAGQGRGRGRR